MQSDTLALVGSGVKVYALCGSIMELEKKIPLDQFKRYIGTSSGSIIALLLNLGLNGTEIISQVDENNLKKVDERLGPFSNYFRKMYNLKTYFGLNRSTIIEDGIKSILTKKGYSITCTFLDLYNKTKKMLTITGTSISDRDTYYFNHITMPNMTLVDAISISTSFPIFFTTKKYMINQKNHVFSDGGLLDSFPILYYPLCDTNNQVFLNKVNKSTRDIDIEDTRVTKVLGIFLLEKNYSNDVFDLYKGFDVIDTLPVFINSFVRTLTDKIDDGNLLDYYNQDISNPIWKYIIPITLDFDVNSMSFNISKEIRQLLLNSGQKSTTEYIKSFVLG
jgi:predicted acylesterase/phospholipase RssA